MENEAVGHKFERDPSQIWFCGFRAEGLNVKIRKDDGRVMVKA